MHLHRGSLLSSVRYSERPRLTHLLGFGPVTLIPSTDSLAYHDDIVVGGVCCRVEPREEGSKDQQIYIMTLGCLAPYRRRGLGVLKRSSAEGCEDKNGRDAGVHDWYNIVHYICSRHTNAGARARACKQDTGGQGGCVVRLTRSGGNRPLYRYVPSFL